MRRDAAVSLLILYVACAPPPPASPPPVPAAVEPIELLPPAGDLTGGWATGSSGEPPPGKVILHPACSYNPPVWIIQQTGNVLRTYAMPSSYSQGIVRAGSSPARVIGSPGTISGSDVTIDDGGVRLVLRYDPATDQLRGTRDGAPFWAVRQVIVKAECPGIP